MAYWLEIWLLLGWRFVANWMEIFSCPFCGPLVGDLVAHYLEIWWPISWRFGGLLVGDLVTGCLELCCFWMV